MMTDKLRCFLDGNALCIVREGFTNIQESPVVFIDLTEQQLTAIRALSGLVMAKGHDDIRTRPLGATSNHFEDQAVEDMIAGKSVLIIVENARIARQMERTIRVRTQIPHWTIKCISIHAAENEARGFEPFDRVYWDLPVETLLKLENWQDLVGQVMMLKKMTTDNDLSPLGIKLAEVKKLAIEALATGSHHKQWFIEEMLKVMEPGYQHQQDPGIPP